VVRLLLAGLVLVLAAGRVEARQSVADYVIGPLDVLSINVHEDDALKGRYTVEADGTFSFPLIGRIKAGGLTIRDFEAALKARLKDGFFVDPQVTVGIEEYRSQRVFVTGEVRTPGILPLTGGMTLVEALARAGGVNAASAAGDVAIVRAKRPDGPPAGGEDGEEPIRISLRDLEAGRESTNVSLKDGDTIYVLRAESLYVFGEVKNPGAVSVQPGMTVLQALALVGGATIDAALNRIRIVRMENGERKELKRVKLTDLVKAGDTIIVPERYFEVL
jgi:polysaccharide export outer membrane protein